jgi:branched-chain amino acid transport system permease protein
MRTATVTAALAATVAVILALGAGNPAGPNAAVVIGIATGAVYGLVALGIVLIYKGSRVFNFAQGEFGTIAAFITYVLAVQMASPLPYWLAAVIALGGVVLLGLGMERVVIRPLRNAPRVTVLVVTIAFSLLAVGVQLLLFLPEAKHLPPLIAGAGAEGDLRGLAMFGYTMSPQEMLVIAVLVGLAVALAYFFSKTDLGLAILATSQDEFATRVVGIGVERVSRFIWGAAAFLGAVAGILFVPIAGALAPGSVTSAVLIPGFTAAVIGGMTSLPGAFVGGIAVGLIQRLAEWASGYYSIGDQVIEATVPGFHNVALVGALLLVLLIRPQGLLGTEA